MLLFFFYFSNGWPAVTISSNVIADMARGGGLRLGENESCVARNGTGVRPNSAGNGRRGGWISRGGVLRASINVFHISSLEHGPREKSVGNKADPTLPSSCDDSRDVRTPRSREHNETRVALLSYVSRPLRKRRASSFSALISARRIRVIRSTPFSNIRGFLPPRTEGKRRG